MSNEVKRNTFTDTTWRRYEDNFSRHLLALARYAQTEMMNALEKEHGHHQLRLSFASYITLLNGGGMRLGDLAQKLGISKQACNQATNQ
ncbi:MAG: hypothetical protein ACI9DH_001568, partial [Halioglobus sp.]